MRDEGGVTAPLGARTPLASELDRRIAALAARQHGVVAGRQLRDLGASGKAIRHRLRAGRLIRLHRGVYALGHRSLTADGHRLAAVLRVGPDAVLSHRSAASVWALPISATRHELVCPRHIARIAGFVVRRTTLRADEITEERGIPLTTVARTLFDLAAMLPEHHLERLVAEAERLGMSSPSSLPDLLERYPRRPGAPALRRVLERLALHGPTRTRSNLEALLVAVLEDLGCERPLVNAPVETATGTFECDLVFRGSRVVIELDTYRTHGDRRAFYSDRSRDRALHAAGWTVARFTDRELEHDPGELRRQLRLLLGRE